MKNPLIHKKTILFFIIFSFVSIGYVQAQDKLNKYLEEIKLAKSDTAKAKLYKGKFE